MSDDERLKRIATDVVRFDPTHEGTQILSAAVLRLLAERDKLAAELAELKKGEPTDAELMAAAVDAQRRADNYAKKLGELSTELAELRAWKEQALAVEREWDAQAVAKMLGVPPGHSCHKGIGERVPAILKELAELRAACERPISNKGRPMNRRKGRMVRASELLKEVGDIIEKWGDTCFYITGLAWGSVALWQNSDYEASAALLARTPEAKS